MSDKDQAPNEALTYIAEHLIRTYCHLHSPEVMRGVLEKKVNEGKMDDIDREVLRLMDAGEYDRIMSQGFDIVDVIALNTLQAQQEGKSHE